MLCSQGVNKDSYLILETLPTEYDSRVKAMEVDERPTEQYSDIGGLDKQIQEVWETRPLSAVKLAFLIFHLVDQRPECIPYCGKEKQNKTKTVSDAHSLDSREVGDCPRPHKGPEQKLHPGSQFLP